MKASDLPVFTPLKTVKNPGISMCTLFFSLIIINKRTESTKVNKLMSG